MYVLIINMPYKFGVGSSTLEIPYQTLEELKAAIKEMEDDSLGDIEVTPILVNEDGSWEVVDLDS